MTELTFAGRVPIIKIHEPLQNVWGWAYVCEENGEQVVDHSGQVCSWEMMQKAAWGYVQDWRLGSEMHKLRAGGVIDSIFFSPDIQKALGIDLGRVGWFLGMHVDSDEAWQGVADGTYTCFSIGGSGEVEELT